MDELRELLAKLGRADDDSLEDLIDLYGLGKGDGDDDDQLDQDFDNLAGNLLGDIELVGESFFKDIAEFRQDAYQMATDLLLRFAEGTFGDTHQLPTYQSVKSNTNEMLDLDIERTVEYRMENPLDEFVPYALRRKTTRNPVVLLIDTSFSMSGLKLMIAGMVVATLSRLIPAEDYCVMGFGKSPYYIKRFDEDLSPYFLISRVLRLLPKGLTNLAEALHKGGELIFPFGPHAQLIVLSDADPTSGKNPIPEAASLPKLDLLLFPEGNEWLGRRLVSKVFEGRLFRIQTLEDVPKILRNLFKHESRA